MSQALATQQADVKIVGCTLSKRVDLECEGFVLSMSPEQAMELACSLMEVVTML